MKILITGGAGYVGYSLIHQLLNEHKDCQISVYDNLSRKNYALFLDGRLEADRIKFIHGEILDSRKLSRAIEGNDMIIHLAAKVITPYADHDAHIFEQVNHWGTAELAMAAEKSDVKTILYLSSLSVYGTHEEPINLTSDLNPRSFYGISKLKGEEHIRRLADKKNVYIVRSGNVYGFNPTMRMDAVINRFMFEANFNGKISIHGSGEQHRAFIHVEKLASILSKMVAGKKKPGIYNLAQYNYSVNEIVDVLAELYPELEYIYVNQNIRMRDVIIDEKERELLTLLDSDIEFKKELRDFRDSFTF